MGKIIVNRGILQPIPGRLCTARRERFRRQFFIARGDPADELAPGAGIAGRRICPCQIVVTNTEGSRAELKKRDVFL
uniref:Uncharacterized protein n=1 Tax=Candidatus Kentrum sp. FW TaxID=2126338 RepID=A0A450TV83_9GAMM|nr:MAG: hypothetical protein BECKFW1821C_GA0114237_103732 [Candidatus Kentron sp. FW]